MNGVSFQTVGIRILFALIFAGIVFLIWNPKPKGSDPTTLDEAEIKTLVSATMVAQEISMTRNQTLTPSWTSTGDGATATPETSERTTIPPTQTPTSTLTETPGNSPTPTPTSSQPPSPTWTAVDSPTPTQTSSPTIPPTATLLPTTTPSPIPARLSGNLLKNGVPVEQNATLILRDKFNNQVAQAVVSANGTYAFDNVPPDLEGYTLLFSQYLNSSFGVYEVFSYGWFGPIIVNIGANLVLPDFDIGLQGFDSINPIPDSRIRLSQITNQTPLAFQWVPHPYASEYWVTLSDDTLRNIWQSGRIAATSVNFNGTLADGSQIQPGQYWWQVGMQGSLGDFTITAFGFFDGFTIIP